MERRIISIFWSVEKSKNQKKTGVNLYYYKERYYSPRESNSLGVDPLAEKYQQFSFYTFYCNNPIGFINKFRLEGTKEPSTDVITILYVIIKPQEELNTKYYATSESSMGTYKILIAYDFKIALEKKVNILEIRKRIILFLKYIEVV